MFVADWHLGRVAVFDEAGGFIRQFGSMGTGPGQMTGPYGIAVDAGGTVYVTDRFNNRIDMLSDEGEFIARLGAEGTGPGKFKWGFPIGIAVAPKGNLWVTDSLSDRIQHWTIPAEAQEAEAEFALGDDPSVEVEVDGGLVESVEGEEAGVNSYEYEGDLLTAYDGPEGETEYAYNKEFNKDKRLTKVTLPNGTYGEIAYEAKGRVSSVTVSDEGAAPQTTVFEYQDEPTRRTTVKRPKEMPLIYELGEDGSVLKSQSEKAPPGIALSGSLFAAKETPSAIKPGDYELVVEASSPAANITSIQVIANGTALVDEKTCEAPCPEEEDRWVTNTSSWSPGILYLEVLVTDSTSEVTSKRFWVNIPYTPPPAPEAEEPPTFAQIQNFREEFGLDLDVKGNERAINNRIFDLIWAWNHPGTPEGEIARATDERWGSPLRAADAAELDYRRQYIDQAASVIPQWAAAHASSSYAGYYVDHREGGIIHVGFTEGQAGKVSALSQESGFMAPARLAPFPVAPKFPHSQLMATQEAIIAHAAELPGFTRVSINAEGNVVSVGTTASIPAMTTALNSILGSGAPVSVFFDTEPPSANAAPKERIERLAGRVRAGDLIYAMPNQKAACTANFGAWEAATNLAGKRVDRHFLLTAGHCAMSLGTEWIRGYKWQEGELKPVSLGKVSRLGTDDPHQIDGEAIRLEGDANAWAPRGIYLTRTTVQGVTGVVAPVIGMPVCTSGVHTNEVLCGEVVGEPVFVSYTNAPIGTYEIPINVLELPGDSGAPVWQGGTGNAIGLWNSGRNPSYISPLLPVPAPYEENISVLSALQLGPGNVSLAP
jgi:hypothetical protein